ncbi:MAG: PBSX family phage terminase large subunit [Oscillospiraceae bacterium]
MRAKATRERVIQRLYEMALARANDAVKLAYCQEPTEDEIRRLDLGAVAEFRRSNLGSVEIRFIDRVEGIAGAGRYAGGRGLRGGGVFPRDGAGGGGSVKEMIPLSLRQRKAFVWWARREYEDYAAIICDGAIRSGKTLAMGMGFFFWAMACFSDRQFALCGRSVGALRRNLLETVLPQLRRLGFACEEKRSEKLLIVRRRGRENRFYLFGGANEASAALIQGMTLAGVLFDEAALMPRSFVEQASARCSVEGSRLWFSCNPDGPNHWFYREWVCRAEEKRALYLHFTMADNPSLSARVRARYESMYSGIFYRRFVLGEWTAAEGRIYDFYAPGSTRRKRPRSRGRDCVFPWTTGR